MNHESLTPVEALQHEIEIAHHEVRTSEGAFRYNKLAVKYLAALELAKSYRELRALLDGKPASGPNGSVKDWHREHKRLQKQLAEADVKLTEALQR